MSLAAEAQMRKLEVSLAGAVPARVSTQHALGGLVLCAACRGDARILYGKVFDVSSLNLRNECAGRIFLISNCRKSNFLGVEIPYDSHLKIKPFQISIPLDDVLV